MVLGVKVVNARFLREAVQAVLVGGSGLVIIIWCPEFLGVQSVFPERMREGEFPTTLLKIAPQSFSYYDSLDDHFNAIIKIADLEEVFHTAKDSDYIEFSQTFQDNGLNGHGYLNANFNRREQTILPYGPYKNFYFPMKIYGILPEGVVRPTDIWHDPSSIPLPPVATFRAKNFAPTLKNLGFKVLVYALEKVVLFYKEGRPLNPLAVNHLNGLISTREDCKIQPIQFYIHMQNLEFMPAAAALSDEVSFFERSENAVLIWFKLALLKGEIIHCLY